MESVSKIIILSDKEEADNIQNLFSRAGLKVVLPDVKRDYTKELVDADLVLEDLSKDTKGKKKVLHECDKEAPPKTILATTASSGITELASATRRAQKFAGLNFIFNPFQDKCLVQITRGWQSSEETVQLCKAMAEKVGATAVEVEDSPGLILDRVLATVINEAAIMKTSKVASIEDIDKITKLCLNWPMGPFEFADTIGIDKVVATLEILSQQLGDQYLPCRLLRQMVSAGQLGKETGKGFYSYK
ncbi:MAG: 3-hydroxyacyl-CoA dehydrogenase family protein [Chloroflexota bacterium]|nr:3-hydroxyacyl-CoA dehydrogenase family protein [Chloroflexota bacterium]